MGDLNKLRKEYADLRKRLDRGQQMLNAYMYLCGRIPTSNISRENERKQQQLNTNICSDNSHWRSTPLPSRPHLASPTKRLNFTPDVQSRDADKSKDRAGIRPTLRVNNWTPGKRKNDLDSRHVGRGTSLAHHGSESKRLRSMERRRARSSPSKLRGASPASSLSVRKRLAQQSQNVWGKENTLHSSRSASIRDMQQRHHGMSDSQFFGEERRDADRVLREENYVEQLLDEGNDRVAAVRAHDVTPKPKSILLTPGARVRKTPNRVGFIDSLNRSRQQTPTLRPLSRSRLGTSTTTPTSSFQGSLHERSFGNTTQPLLGYDWIAGLLDTDPTYQEKSDAYLEEIKHYRELNREECVHDTVLEGRPDEGSFSESFPGTEEPHTEPQEHKCIHNYALNSRLFAVPLHGNQDGESLCAICQTRRSSKPRSSSPSYIRVSIPRSTLMSPYRVRPHRRQSFDPTDSVGLSQHCLAGWQNSRPSMMPPASTVDLRASLDRTMVAASTLFDPVSSDIYDTSAGRPLGPSQHTQELLNRSHAMRVDLQRLERSGLSMAPSLGTSRNYPLL